MTYTEIADSAFSSSVTLWPWPLTFAPINVYSCFTSYYLSTGQIWERLDEKWQRNRRTQIVGKNKRKINKKEKTTQQQKCLPTLSADLNFILSEGFARVCNMSSYFPDNPLNMSFYFKFIQMCIHGQAAGMPEPLGNGYVRATALFSGTGLLISRTISAQRKTAWRWAEVTATVGTTTSVLTTIITYAKDSMYKWATLKAQNTFKRCIRS